MSEEDINEEDVFDEDLVRELGLDPADLQGPALKKERRPVSPAAKASVEGAKKPTAAAGSVQEPVEKPVPKRPEPPKNKVKAESPPKPPVRPKTPEVDHEYAAEVSKNIPVQVAAVIAKKSARLKDLLELKKGEVLEFKKPTNEPLDLVANGKLIAKAELVLVEGKIGARIVKLIK